MAVTLDPAPADYRLTVWLFLRALGGVYTVAFLALALQLEPLLGRGGLLPAHLYLDRLSAAGGVAWMRVPSLFWLSAADGTLVALAWLGVGLSVLLLAGYATSLHLLALWVLYSTFVNIGQLFYGYGWEILLLETGFLAAFLAPLRRGGWRHTAPPSRAVLWLLRWLLFRVMFGAGLIKLRGDPCWWDLTCLFHHFETQPLPSPLSPFLHALPGFVLRLGVVFSHLVEVVVPFLFVAPPKVRRVAGGLTALFMLALIASGNLAFLNHLTLVLCITCFDDALVRRWAPRRLVERMRAARVLWQLDSVRPPAGRRRAVTALVIVVALLSVGPIANMLSARQVMNTSFDPLNLVNTYGAFGHIGKVRHEVVLMGTLDEEDDVDADWREYELPCKPGDPGRRPCVVAPYHLRLDWQIWFAAMADYRSQPWLVHLVYKLLHAEPTQLALFANDPFDSQRPRWIRADLYEYRFAGAGEEGWWKRRRIGEYLPALAADDPGLRRIVEGFGWPLLSPGRVDADHLVQLPSLSGCGCGDDG